MVRGWTPLSVSIPQSQDFSESERPENRPPGQPSGGMHYCLMDDGPQTARMKQWINLREINHTNPSLSFV